jgi:hypothetical protein
MKRFGVASLGVLFIGVVYYLLFGSTQLVAQMQKQIDKEVAVLKEEGFSVVEANLSATSKSYTITLDNRTKVQDFLYRHGVALSIEDIGELEGLKVGVEVTYLGSISEAVAFDIYPIALPPRYALGLSQGDKRLFDAIEQMLHKRSFLIHIALNKPLNHFHGYIKDINETMRLDEVVKIVMKGITFEGDIASKRVSQITQEIAQMQIDVGGQANINLSHLTSNYALGSSDQAGYKSSYHLKHLTMEAPSTYLEFEDLAIDSRVKVEGNLSSMTLMSDLASLRYRERGKRVELAEVALRLDTHNIDLQRLESMSQIDPNNELALFEALQQLLSHGITLNLTNFSIQKIALKGREIEGFKLASHVAIDPSLDIRALEYNPMVALNAIDANLSLALSSDIFGFIAQQPEAMMTMMLVQPNDINGTKHYDLSLQKGRVMVNGRPLL